MSAKRARRIPVFAIVRVDLDVVTPDLAVAIKEVVPTLQDAEPEVQRLNLLNSEKNCRYFWRATRYFPDGSAGLEDS
jgi:hypothetical protein